MHRAFLLSSLRVLVDGRANFIFTPRQWREIQNSARGKRPIEDGGETHVASRAGDTLNPAICLEFATANRPRDCEFALFFARQEITRENAGQEN